MIAEAPSVSIARLLTAALVGAGVTPASTVVSLTAGRDGITVPTGDLAKFAGGRTIAFFDVSATPAVGSPATPSEEWLPIAATWSPVQGNPIPLDFTGTGYTQLQYEHAPGAVVGTNLYDEVPTTDAFATAFPVVWIEQSSETGRLRAIPTTVEPDYNFALQYRVNLAQPRPVGTAPIMNPSTWARRVRTKAKRDVRALIQAILAADNLEAVALGIGPFDGTDPPLYTTQYGDLQTGTQQPAGLQIGATVSMSVRGTWDDYEP